MSRRSRWTAADVEAFLDATVDSQLEAAWHLIAFAGLRVGEVLALRWADIDAAAGLLRVRHAVVGVPYSALAVPGSIAGERVVDALPAIDVLVDHHERQEAIRSEWGSEHRDDSLVVCREGGRPLHSRELHRAFARLICDAGLPEIQLPDLRRSGRRAASRTEARP